MAKQYTGIKQDKRYSGEDIDITYSPRHCIHAAECVRSLPQSFNPDERPWIKPDAAAADALAATVAQCPSGALHFIRKDGGAAEAAPAVNVISVWHNGPLQVHGDLHLTGATVAVAGETRATLCRCGESQHKPFCDNAHRQVGFSASEVDPGARPIQPQSASGPLTITAVPNGPLQLEGPFEVRDHTGKLLFSGTKGFLCRCGHSASKPFCDGTHQIVGFQAE